MGSALLIPYDFARAQRIAMVRDEGTYCDVAITRETSIEAIAEARRILGKPLRTQRLEPEGFALALAKAYSANAAMAPVAPATSATSAAGTLPSDNDVLAMKADDGPAAQAVNQWLVHALNAGASDIHLEPYESQGAARMRVDGELREMGAIESALFPAVVARLKVLARLDLAERRLPQDGRLAVHIAGRSVDVRMSTLPSAFGERVVLRLLDQSKARLDLSALGLSDASLAAFRQLLAAPHGIVLVTGPTGSGKTTTLYAALAEIAQRTRNVMTVEDPIEYAIHGISQTAVNPGIGLTFARALRSILRQDPDVILIGEIRDAETAQIAVQASLTGHLVLATLHTNDATSAVTRLMDMGIEPYLLASSLRGVLAQRLVRKLCASCRVSEPVTASAKATLIRLSGGAHSVEALYRASGCARCENTGYQGRTGVYETLAITPSIASLIQRSASQQDLRASATAQGTRSLAADAVRWLRDGTTSLDEALRIGAQRQRAHAIVGAANDGERRAPVLCAFDLARQWRANLACHSAARRYGQRWGAVARCAVGGGRTIARTAFSQRV
jgi:general secretion pathway protein E